MRRLRYLLSNLPIALLLAMLAPRLATADPIDSYIRTAMMQQHIPGLALAVIRDGRPVKVATYGFANVELRVPVTRSTVFRLASVSKQIIATGVMLLVADGKLTLHDPICTYLEQCPSAWRPITIEELLSHTSGLPMEAPGNGQFRVESVESVESVEAGIRRAYSVPLRSKPGERWAYRLSDGTSTHYAFGWWIDEVRGHRRIRHGGSEPGFLTEYARFPDDHIDVIILSNGSSFRPDDMAVDISGQFFHGLSIERRTIALTPALLSTYAGRYQLSPSTILVIGVDGTAGAPAAFRRRCRRSEWSCTCDRARDGAASFPSGFAV